MVIALIEDVDECRTELDLMFCSDQYSNKLKAVYHKGLNLLEELLEKGVVFERPCTEADDALIYVGSFLTDNDVLERAYEFVEQWCDSFYDQAGRSGLYYYKTFCRNYDRLLNKYLHLGIDLRKSCNLKLTDCFIQSFNSLFNELRLLLNLPFMKVSFDNSIINCFNKTVKKHVKLLRNVEKNAA